MNGPSRGLASCGQERDRSGAVSCAELLEIARQKGKPIPMPAALRIASEVLEVLDNSEPKGAAACGLVSPRTIFVGPQGEAYLKGASEVTSSGPVSSGRRAYMAPEHAGGWVADRRCDLFSVGAVLYEMLTGHRLFSAGPDIETLVAPDEADLSAIAEPTVRLPLELRLILASALAREPDERFQEPRDFADAIRAFAHHVQLRLDRAVVTSFLATLELPSRSGTYAKPDLPQLDGFGDTPLETADAAAEPGRRVR
jgi:serine/threonine protein kinase